ncbi:hypothetical protein BFJ66_g1029 [Fusarium oxysporum f. sp. cepae]|uniref:Uncharacterized protein n=1 Tax=Fusarium oxysporum f. sp. cepae TaxID=396571 RepID=A0A3L6NIF4_FUSOX|nr:hypothetical protein BFJ65_g7828 [Fusarium oxysporum f. sp. cepae]RKK62222.1 hypothetical protein BFJ66_g1029 [Fusarium oxysporum f. sp. cepae]RKK64484.1 hypothetical protein BFJ67_g443 [Fusarium oxysporum f. sp. cepae]
MVTHKAAPQTNLKVILVIDGKTHHDITEAAATHPDEAREALIQSLSPIHLENSHLNRIQLQELFRRSLSAQRDSTPYRLQAVIDQGKHGQLDTKSLDGRFYCHGGARAVAAYAAALADQKEVASLLETLSAEDFRRLLEFIDNFEEHPDLRYITRRAERTKPRATKRKRLPRSRQRRGIRQPRGGHRPYHEHEGPQRGEHSVELPTEPNHFETTTSTLPQVDCNDDLARFTIPHCYNIPAATDDLDHFMIPRTHAAHFAAGPDPFDIATWPGYSE